MLPKEPDKNDLKKHLDEIAKILAWFEAQDELDVEQALEKVKQAAVLIKAGKERLAKIENEFKEIKAEVEE
jgi:exonuclease VII small subunit